MPLPRLLAAAVCLWLVSGMVWAAPFVFYGPRALAMGGAGVAAASPDDAVYYNPALMASARADDDFNLVIPSAAAHFKDPENLRQSAQEFRDERYFLRLAVDLLELQNEMNPAMLPQRRDDVVDSAVALRGGLVSISEKPLEFNAAGGSILGFPGQGSGLAVSLTAWSAGGGVGILSQQDLADIDQAIAVAQSGSGTIDVNLTDNFTSEIRARYAIFAELGVTYARRIQAFGGPLAVGVTPKFVQVWTYDYRYVARELDQAQLDWTAGERLHSNFNLDAGAARQLSQRWRLGVVAKHLIPQSYPTARSDTPDIELSPQWRLGLARTGQWFNLAMDLDLSRNEAVDYEGDTRYFGLGVEFDAWRTVQARIGVRTNLLDDQPGILALGLGFSPFGMHVDAGLAGNQNEIAAGIQLGLRL